MVDEKKKKGPGRPRKPIREEEAVNEDNADVLDMSDKGGEVRFEDLTAAWKSAFGKIATLSDRAYKIGSSSGMSTTITKWNKLNPFLQNERIKALFTQTGTYTKGELSDFLADPAHHERELRAAGWANSASQQIYYNILRRSCDVPLYKHYVVPDLLPGEKDYGSDDFKDEYRLVEEWLATFGVARSLKTMALQIKREGKQSYILRNRIDGTGKSRTVRFAALEKLPSDWVRITGIGQLGFTVSFDMMYFLNMANSPSDFGDFIEKAWEDMLSHNMIIEGANGVKELDYSVARGYSFQYKGASYDAMIEKVTGGRRGKGEHYLFWLRMPYDFCFTFGSDNSHSWCAPDTMGCLRSLQELSDYGKLAGLIASTPLTAILTGEAEFIDNARAGLSETKLAPEVISGLQDIFNATTSTNIEAMFFPLKNIKLQQLQADVNSSDIISTATENFVETVGEGGLTITTEKPNVSQVKTAQLLAESAQDYVTEQFRDVLNFIIQRKLGFKYKWKLVIWGGIFTFEGEKKYTKELVAGGNVALLPKLMSADGLTMRDTEALTRMIDSMDFYKMWRTFTQEYQADQALAEAKADQKGDPAAGEKKVGRPALDDGEIDNDSTAKSRDDGTNVSGNREDYSAKCPLCGAELFDGQEVCEECAERIAESIS